MATKQQADEAQAQRDSVLGAFHAAKAQIESLQTVVADEHAVVRHLRDEMGAQDAAAIKRLEEAERNRMAAEARHNEMVAATVRYISQAEQDGTEWTGKLKDLTGRAYTGDELAKLFSELETHRDQAKRDQELTQRNLFSSMERQSQQHQSERLAMEQQHSKLLAANQKAYVAHAKQLRDEIERLRAAKGRPKEESEEEEEMSAIFSKPGKGRRLWQLKGW